MANNHETAKISPVVLDFFPHNPYPPRTGAHHRCMQIIEGLRDLGCKVFFCSSTLFSETTWNTDARNELLKAGLSDVLVHEPSWHDLKVQVLMSRSYKKLKRPIPLDSIYYTPPGLRRWFSRLVHRIRPDIVLINYAYWGALAGKGCRRSIKVIDYHDILSINRVMRRAIMQHLPPTPIDAEDVEEAVVTEDFFSGLNFPELENEMRIFDRFDYTLCITSHEAELINDRTTRTKTITLPVTMKTYPMRNTYKGPALFPTGPNPFNVQGYVYLVRKVLPLVRQVMENPLIVVTGSCCEQVQPATGIELAGHINDMRTLYADAGFVVCPIFGGTGQQIKIVEAMANGLPVVALRRAAEATPLEHGISGWVAEDAAGFAEGMVRLWRDRDLCRSMGEEGRKKIERHFSAERTKSSLWALLEDIGFKKGAITTNERRIADSDIS
ncbi:MAG: glycosyltransferase family 4 protein [Actinobacteria bacterium]|nr:glycosyltransferase family 4 protein [Actinomycetota bacterium]